MGRGMNSTIRAASSSRGPGDAEARRTAVPRRASLLPPISAASVLSEKYRIHLSLLFRFRCMRSLKACSSCGVWMLAGITQAAFGQVRVANELRKRGLTVSPLLACAVCGCATTWRP
jgi:hypothetical protein